MIVDLAVVQDTAEEAFVGIESGRRHCICICVHTYTPPCALHLGGSSEARETDVLSGIVFLLIAVMVEVRIMMDVKVYAQGPPRLLLAPLKRVRVHVWKARSMCFVFPKQCLHYGFFTLVT